MANPLVLVVDDEERNLDVRRKQLEKRELKVVVAGSREAALTELNASPEMDAVITDIRLDKNNPTDTSGLDLAREISVRYADLPMVAYSAVVREGVLTPEDESLFIRGVAKGSKLKGELEEVIEAIRDAAVGHREQRRQRADMQRAELLGRSSVQLSHATESVRRLLPHSRDTTDIEATLRTAGYHLELVTCSAFRVTANPLLVWLKDVEDGVEAEVYGESILYSHGSDADEAIERLVELMCLYAEDFNASTQAEAGPAVRLRLFLERTINLSQEG